MLGVTSKLWPSNSVVALGAHVSAGAACRCCPTQMGLGTKIAVHEWPINRATTLGTHAQTLVGASTRAWAPRLPCTCGRSTAQLTYGYCLHRYVLLGESISLSAQGTLILLSRTLLSHALTCLSLLLCCSFARAACLHSHLSPSAQALSVSKVLFNRREIQRNVNLYNQFQKKHA